VVVAPSGAKSFFLSYTSPEDGKRKQVAVGRFPSMSLREARLKASEVREQVDKGKDPAFDRRADIEARMAKRELGTLGDLLDLYASDLEMDGKRTAKEVRRITGKDIPAALLSRPAYLISRDDVLDILTPIAQRGALVHSDNVRAYLRAAFELGLHAQSMTRWRGRAKDFQITFNPVATVRKSVSRKPVGMRALSEDEVRQLWQTNLLTPQMHLALKLILASGQRVEEVLHARWDELNADLTLWTITGERRKTRNKTAEPHLVPLTDLHQQLLEEARSLSGDAKHLFPARNRSEPLRYDSLNHAVRRFIEASGMISFSPRDLRRTFKTLGGSFGISLEMRNRLQGHALSDVGSVHYDRYDYLSQKREAMASFIDQFEALLGR
jgi:integrase